MESVTVRLILIDGTIGGLVTAEVNSAWSGHVISSPLSRLDDLKKREELKRSGVYILLSENSAYIGESETIVERWKDPKHAISTGKYNRVIVVTDNALKLTKGHIKYLEARLMDICNKAKRTNLDNETNQQRQLNNLPEGDRIDMENFLRPLINVVLPTIGVDVFKQAPTVMQQGTANMPKVNSPIFEIKGKGYSATAQIINDEYVLSKGALLRKSWGGRQKKNYKLRMRLIETGVIVEDEKGLTLTQDYSFSSPSAAASVVCGSESLNGPANWIIKGTTTTYKKWIESQLIEE